MSLPEGKVKHYVCFPDNFMYVEYTEEVPDRDPALVSLPEKGYNRFYFFDQAEILGIAGNQEMIFKTIRFNRSKDYYWGASTMTVSKAVEHDPILQGLVNHPPNHICVIDRFGHTRDVLSPEELSQKIVLL